MRGWRRGRIEGKKEKEDREDLQLFRAAAARRKRKATNSRFAVGAVQSQRRVTVELRLRRVHLPKVRRCCPLHG